MNCFRANVLFVSLLGFFLLLVASSFAQKREKLPRPIQMDAGVGSMRSPATGELVFRRGTDNAAIGGSVPPVHAAIRVRVNLVEVACNVFAPDNTAVRGLAQPDFHIFEDGVEQRIAHFDASMEGASIALVLDASPSVLPDSDTMKFAARQLIANLSPVDEVAVVDFSEHTYLLLPFSRDRKLLEKESAGVDVRKLFADTGGSNIYRSVYLAANELFPGRMGRKAIILLTDGQDSGLGLSLDGEGVRPRRGDAPNRATFEDIVRALASQNIDIYAISTQNRPRVMTPAWLAAHQNVSLVTPAALALGIPAYTDFLAELVRRAGGELYFLNETGTIADAYRRIVQNLSAQYTLGFYPAAGQKPGWHSLRVEVVGHGSVRVVHRASYYEPADLQ